MAARVVCLDTNVLSWLFRTCRDQQEEKIDRAEELILRLKKEKTVVAIPAIVLAEALCFIPDDMVQDFLNEIRKSYLVFPFNEMAAYHYRIITRSCRDMRVEGPRWSKSADIKIISIALANGASCLYSEDADLAKLAANFLPVQGLPSLPPKQISLPLSPKAQ